MTPADQKTSIFPYEFKTFPTKKGEQNPTQLKEASGKHKTTQLKGHTVPVYLPGRDTYRVGEPFVIVRFDACRAHNRSSWLLEVAPFINSYKTHGIQNYRVYEKK